MVEESEALQTAKPFPVGEIAGRRLSSVVSIRAR
jgi:hypothetical protein